MVERLIYQITTRVWLGDLRARLDKKIGLAGVPASEWFDSLSRRLPWLRRRQFSCAGVSP